jgi:hypothetical protein
MGKLKLVAVAVLIAVGMSAGMATAASYYEDDDTVVWGN